MREPRQQEFEELFSILSPREGTLMLRSLTYLHSLGFLAQRMVLSIVTMCLPTSTNVIMVILHRHGQRPMSQMILDSDTDHHKEIIMWDSVLKRLCCHLSVL